jgi:hypothetical protein
MVCIAWTLFLVVLVLTLIRVLPLVLMFKYAFGRYTIRFGLLPFSVLPCGCAPSVACWGSNDRDAAFRTV